MEEDRNGSEVLSRAQCLELLAGVQVGRVVVSDRVLPAAFPVNFVLFAGDVLFLADADSTVEAATAGHVVAFQADDIDPMSQSGWSVLIQGRACVVDDIDELRSARAMPLVPWMPLKSARFIRVRSEIVSGHRVLPLRLRGRDRNPPFQGRAALGHAPGHHGASESRRPSVHVEHAPGPGAPLLR